MKRGRTIRNAASARQAEPVMPAKQLFSVGSGGRWATSMLKRAALEGKAITSACLRTLDTLRHDEWKHFDDAVQEEALIRLVGVADLIGRGLTAPVPNALGKTLYEYEKVTFMDDAEVSLDGTSRTHNDLVEFDLAGIPLPITHKDFFINLRKLAASRERGEPLDTTQVRLAGRVVSEKAEDLLFNGYSGTFGGFSIYGYTTFPSRITSVTFVSNKSWEDSSKAADDYVDDVLAALSALNANRMYGPFVVYVPTDAGVRINADYLPAGGSATMGTIKQRLLMVDAISDIRTADTLATGQIVFVQMTKDVVTWVQGENLQTVQWDEGGGFTINFKAWQIAVPLLRADITGRCGILHMKKT